MPRVTRDPLRVRAAHEAAVPSSLERRTPSYRGGSEGQTSVAIYRHNTAGLLTGKLVVRPLVYVSIHGPTKYAAHYDDPLLDH